ncbi:MAG: 2-dehydro-3-deoxyphosphogluconate aldolase [Proteobacteria bacterium SG_bin9]|nr:MAG: 2-dehydro-3-deoxyphosphogluconate aldolase [Proteobacteria bacterium SG_bin9]
MKLPADGRQALLDMLTAARVVPVLTIARVEHAVPLARALVKGGVRTLEITLRTPVATEAAQRIIAEVPDAIVGIGTVTRREDLMHAMSLGAKFAVSPGASPELLATAVEFGFPFLPGVATASELMAVQMVGLTTMKFFPAGPAGGIPMLRALAGPFPHVRFCPTGGIGDANAAEWLAEPNVIAVGGSWLTPAAEVEAGSWDAITARAERTMKALR